jgi:hypothetical protein
MDFDIKLPSGFNIAKIIPLDNAFFILTKNASLFKFDKNEKSLQLLTKEKIIDFSFFNEDPTVIYYLTTIKNNLSSIKSLDLKNNQVKELYRPIVPAGASKIFSINSNEIYVFLSDGQIIKSLDKGNSWTSVAAFKENILSIFYNEKFKAFFLLTKNNFFRSDDGANFQNLTEYLTNFQSTNRKLVFQAFWAQNNIYILASNQLFISKDGGYNFSKKQIAIAKNISPISMVIENISDDKTNIILSSKTQIYVSQNDGASWKLIPNPSKFFISFITTDKSIKKLYLGISKI